MKTAEKALLFAAAAMLSGGCGYATQGYRTQTSSLAPREANCPLEIFSTLPKGENKELGFVEFKPRGMAGGLPKTKEEAMRHAQLYACQAGGNGLLVMRDGKGQFSKATILRVEKRR